MSVARILAIAAAMCLLGPVHASPANPVIDTDYVAVPGPHTPGQATGEVVEFFSYGCVHCARFHKPLAAWAERQPGVKLKRVHVSFGRPDDPYQRLYYTLESLGQATALTPKIFEAVHQERQRLSQPEVLERFIKATGIDQAAFAAAYRSPAVNALMAEAARVEARMGVQGTPVVVINNRYLTGPGFFAESHRSKPGVEPSAEITAALDTAAALLKKPRPAN